MSDGTGLGYIGLKRIVKNSGLTMEEILPRVREGESFCVSDSSWLFSSQKRYQGDLFTVEEILSSNWELVECEP